MPTQAILRDRLTPEQATAARACAEATLAANDPGDPDNPANWARWARLMPHVLAADLTDTGNPKLRWMACNACWYLLARGDTRTAHDLARDLRQVWLARLGGDDRHTLTAAAYLGSALQDMGRYAEARDLHQDTLDRMRRVLGPDHPHTLASTNNLASDLYMLGEVQAARRRRVLGPDHPSTLNSASNLAADLRALGEADDDA